MQEAITFGALLRRFRDRAGLTHEALAERAGASAAAISALERGRRQHPYPDTVSRLAEALGLSPDERAAFRSLASVSGAGAPTAASAGSRQASAVNLPVPRTSLIGRERDIATLAELVPAHPGRLVTLTGIGGGGKTRLALAVAGELRGIFADDVWLIELAPLVDPALVPMAVAAVLDIPEVDGVPVLERLAVALHSRRMLLVLDNCEHLIDACAELGERLLAACPDVSILATSREPLQLACERQWRVPALSAPGLDEAVSLATLADYPAVRLFVARAQAVVPEFGLTEANAGAVAQVCTRLDGIPLALELAAARVRVLPVAQILERLDDALRLLTEGSRAAPTRQQTLRATLDWSYELLTAPEQAVFRRLAVFLGGCALEAAEAVCAGGDLDPAEVLDLLTRLVDKSLVLVEEAGGAARFRLLEPVRQYAQQRLAASGEADAARAHHTVCYLALAERAVPELRGPAQVAWLHRLDGEHDNLRAALRWAEAYGDAETAARLAIALAPFWEGRGYLSEGRRWLKSLLAVAAAGTIPAAARARAMVGAGRLAHWQTDLDDAAALFEESLALAREQGDDLAIAESLVWLGTVYRQQGSLARGAELLSESLALYQAIGDRAGIAWALLNLGVTVRFQGDVARAAALLEESLARYRELGDVRFIAITLTMLGFAVLQQGDSGSAAALIREGLAGHQAVGDRAFLVFGLMDLAAVLVAQGQAVLAARLLGATTALRETLSAPLPPVSRRTHESVVVAVRTQLREADFTAAWAAGRALTLDQAVTEALAAGPPATPSHAPAAAIPPEYPGERLTRREREVARLLAQGYTDRQIAAALTIAVGTVGVHVHHILAKLGLHSRWQVAAWAGTYGLSETHPD